MNVLNQIFGIVFYVLFFSWIFFKIRNVILIKKNNYKEVYKSIKKEIKQTKFSRILFIILMINVIILLIYIAGLIILFMLQIIFVIFSFFAFFSDGISYEPIILKNIFLAFSKNFYLLEYITYCYYFILYTFFIRNIYINILVYKKLNNVNLLDNLQQNINK